jgi:type I restriction enzyme S subunit
MPQYSLGDLGEWGSGGTPLASHVEYYGGDIPWLIIEDLNDGIVCNSRRTISALGLENSSAKMVPRGTVLIAMYGSIGKLGVADMACATNQAMAFCKCDPEKITPWFLFYLLLNERRHFIHAGRGGTQQNITQEFLREYRVSIPTLSEQRGIVRLLEKSDRLRRMRIYTAELGEKLSQSVFAEMFGDPVANPHGWAMAPLEECLDAFEGGVNIKPVSDNEPASDWRVLKVSAVTTGRFDPGESKPISPSATFTDKPIVKMGDVIMSRANTSALVGAICRVRETPGNVLLPDKLWRLKFRRFRVQHG